MAMEVKGKTAIITGAGSGIDLAFAQLLLSKGCNVVFADIALQPEAEATLQHYRGVNNDNNTSTTAELQSVQQQQQQQQQPPAAAAEKARAIFQQTDVTDWTQLDRMFTVAESEFGGADIVCPGAGVYEPPFSNFWIPPGSTTTRSKDNPDGHRYAQVDINITHPIRVTQLAIAHFLKHGRAGVVVHIASIAAQKPHLPCPVYVASKYAISGFVRSLAQLEFPPSPPLSILADKSSSSSSSSSSSTTTRTTIPSIRVNAVAPGVIKTPLWTQHPEKLGWVEEGTDEWVTAEEVANVMYDCVTKQEYIGGSVIEVGKQTRFVETLNDPGPQGAGHSVSQTARGIEEVWERLSTPGWGLV